MFADFFVFAIRYELEFLQMFQFNQEITYSVAD